MKNLVRFASNSKGVTYIMALMIVMVTGIMLGSVGQTWKMVMQREREEELIFRGMQIQAALSRWHNPRGTQTPATPLTDLNHLLRDPRVPGNVKHLRRLYTDPVAKTDWLLIKDPARGIVGVASTSQEKPLKQENFPDELKDFAGKQKYSEWVFSYRPGVVVPTAQQPGGLPTMPQPQPK